MANDGSQAEAQPYSVPFHDLMQQLDAQLRQDGDHSTDITGVESPQPAWSREVFVKRVEVSPRQPAWSHEVFVGVCEPMSVESRDRCKTAFQESGSLSALQARTRLGKAPFKQRAAETKRLPMRVRPANSLAGKSARRHQGRSGTQAAEQLLAPEQPWRLSDTVAATSKRWSCEELPGLHSRRPKTSEPSATSEGAVAVDRSQELVRVRQSERAALCAPATDSELLALRERSVWTGGPTQGLLGPEERNCCLEPEAVPCSATHTDEFLQHRHGQQELGELAEDPTQSNSDPVNAEGASLASLESRFGQADVHEPGSFKIAGTWNNFKHSDMIFVGFNFVFFVSLGRQGWESFQILYKGDWNRTLYPSVVDGNPFELHSVMGPDDKGHGKNWTIGRHAHDKGPPGTWYKVELVFDDPSVPLLVKWEVVGAEASMHRAKEQVMRQAAVALKQREVGGEEPQLPSMLATSSSKADISSACEERPEATRQTPKPLLTLIRGEWDGVPLNLGQAYDIGSAFTLCVLLRTPSAHPDQGGRILAKRHGRSGWELVAPRRETGEVSFYSSGGGHLNLGPTRVDDGLWHHVAVTFDEKGEMCSYIDGRLDGRVKHIVRPQPDAELWLGTRSQKSGLFLGELADVHVFDHALVEDEVLLLVQLAVGSFRD